MATTNDNGTQCPGCGKTVKDDLTKYDIHSNKWVAYDAGFLVLRSFKHYPVRTSVLAFGIPAALIGALTFVRFIIVPGQVAASASTSEKVAAHAASFVRPMVGAATIGANNALGGAPISVQEVNSLQQGSPQAIPVQQRQIAPAQPSW